MTNKPLISIIILNYNTGELLQDCINSVMKSKYENYEIILVDNASKDKSYRTCKEKYPNIKLIENQTNLGYCEGNNIGIKSAKGDFLVILNPDTTVEPNWLSELYEASCYLGPHLYQPKLLAANEKKRINTAGNMINLFGFGYSRGKGLQDTDQFNQQEMIGYASGACLFASKNIFDKIGLFDPYLFAYHDDLDLGWRAAQQGIRSYFIPSSVVYHAESFSFQWSPRKFYLLERNRLYCLLTHYSKSTLHRILPSLIVIEILMLMFYLSKGMIKEKTSGYMHLIKNRKLIHEKHIELESKKTISDKELIKNFTNTIEVPIQVSGYSQSKIFNSILSIFSKFSRIVI